MYACACVHVEVEIEIDRELGRGIYIGIEKDNEITI